MEDSHQYRVGLANIATFGHQAIGPEEMSRKKPIRPFTGHSFIRRERNLRLPPASHFGSRAISGCRSLAEHGLHPSLVVEIPAHGFADATLKGVGRGPTQFALQF